MPSSAPSVDLNMRVGYPGRDGAHSAAACDRLFPDAELVPLPTFHAVVEATSSGEIAFGVLPIESSLSGPVAETHDLLYGSPLAIAASVESPFAATCAAASPVVGAAIAVAHGIAASSFRHWSSATG